MDVIDGLLESACRISDYLKRNFLIILIQLNIFKIF
jgi:hypothetical protein